MSQEPRDPLAAEIVELTREARERGAKPSELVDALPDELREALPPWAKKLAFVLDDLIRLPGMERGVGLDAILGFLLPGAGDALTAIGSVALLGLAIKRRVPGVILTRMVMNIGLDALIGAVPIAGDLFDVFFRSNRRNLELIEAHQGGGKEPSKLDYAIVGVGLGFVVLSVVLPLAIGIAFGVKLMEWLAGL